MMLESTAKQLQVVVADEPSDHVDDRIRMLITRLDEKIDRLGELVSRPAGSREHVAIIVRSEP